MKPTIDKSMMLSIASFFTFFIENIDIILLLFLLYDCIPNKPIWVI
jgi:hypothetical protein